MGEGAAGPGQVSSSEFIVHGSQRERTQKQFLLVDSNSPEPFQRVSNRYLPPRNRDRPDGFRSQGLAPSRCSSLGAAAPPPIPHCVGCVRSPCGCRGSHAPARRTAARCQANVRFTRLAYQFYHCSWVCLAPGSMVQCGPREASPRRRDTTERRAGRIDQASQHPQPAGLLGDLIGG